LANRGDTIMGGLPHSFSSTAESNRGGASDLTPMLVVAQEPRSVSKLPLDGSP
jgi:hypothetical protein